jgi:hypothetical protein
MRSKKSAISLAKPNRGCGGLSPDFNRYGWQRTRAKEDTTLGNVLYPVVASTNGTFAIRIINEVLA